MGFTTPATVTAGTAATAAYANTYIRDNIAWMATDSPTCRAYGSAGFVIGNTTASDITCNSERFDNAAMHSTSSSTARMTVPTGGAGKYLVGGTGIWSASAGGVTRILYNTLNAAPIARSNVPVTAGGVQGCAILTAYAAIAADYFTMQGYQDSGGFLTLTGDPGPGPEIFAFWFRT